MKVRELIERLKTQPQEADVSMDSACGCSPLGSVNYVLSPSAERYGKFVVDANDVILSSETEQ